MNDGYIVSNIRSVEDTFQKLIEECVTYGWRKREIEVMMLNALDRTTKEGTESD